jgi:hypothetical protein
MFSCIGLVIFQNYRDNKLNSHNFVDYSYRVLFLIANEIIFDWIKNIIVFKISNLKPSLIKNVTLDLAVYHDKLRYNCFQMNGNTEHKEHKDISEYIRVLESYRLNIIKKESNLHTMSSHLDSDNILVILLKCNILIHCIIVSFYIVIFFNSYQVL